VQLLTQAGYTAYYELGEITMNTAQLAAWLGTDPTNFFSSYYVFQYGGYPLSSSYDGTEYTWTKLPLKKRRLILSSLSRSCVLDRDCNYQEQSADRSIGQSSFG